MGKILPSKNPEDLEKMEKLGEVKAVPSTHSSRILPAKTIRPHQTVGELVFKVEADGQVGVQCQIPAEPFYAKALASACMAFVREMEQKGILKGTLIGPD